MEGAMERVWESGRRIGRGMGMEAWGVDEAFMAPLGSRGSRGGGRSGRRNADDDEEALRWAAIERLPTYSRVRTAILSSSAASAEADQAPAAAGRPQYKEVDVRRLGVGERQGFIERVFRVAEEDNQRLLQKLRNRIDRLGGATFAPSLFPSFIDVKFTCREGYCLPAAKNSTPPHPHHKTFRLQFESSLLNENCS
jgi:hypothetical protein